MKRRLFLVSAILLVVASVGVFAAERRSKEVSYLASFNGPGTIDLTVTGGFSWFGLGLNAGAEFTVGQFDVGPVPLSWGITAQGSVGLDPAGIGLAVSGLPTLNIGFDFGKNLRFEGFLGLGVGFVLESWAGGGSGLGISEYAGWTWWFANSFGLTIEEGSVSAFGWGYWYFAGIGVTLKI